MIPLALILIALLAIAWVVYELRPHAPLARTEVRRQVGEPKPEGDLRHLAARSGNGSAFRYQYARAADRRAHRQGRRVDPAAPRVEVRVVAPGHEVAVFGPKRFDTRELVTLGPGVWETPCDAHGRAVGAPRRVRRL